MAALQAEQLATLIATTQQNLGRFQVSEIASELTEYIAMNSIMRKKRVKFKGGTAVKFNAMVTTSKRAKMVGNYSIDDPNVGDTQENAVVPWRQFTTDYSFDVNEIAMNQGMEARILELIKLRRGEAMIDQTELLEDQFWGKPVDSTNNLDAFGIDYWIVPNSATGFNGGNASGFSLGPGGLSASAYAKWRNWTAEYAAVSKEDLVKKMREASMKTKFKSPTAGILRSYETGEDYAYYTNYDVYGTLTSLLEDQNENLGNDVASKEGQVQFKQRPVIYVPKLDANSGDPVYGINWSVFKTMLLTGRWMVETTKPAPLQHTVVNTFMDGTFNWVCYNRRMCFRIDKA